MTGKQKMVRVSALITNYTSIFAAITTIYLLYSTSSLSSELERKFSESRRTGFFVLLMVFMIGNAARAYFTGFVQRNVYVPDKAARMFKFSVAGLVLTVIWLVLIIRQVTERTWLVTYMGLDAIYLVMALVDMVLYPIMVYGTYKLSQQRYSSASMDAVPGSPKSALPPIKLPANNGFTQQQGFNNDDNTRS